MNRKEKLFVATTENGERYWMLDEFASHYAEMLDDGEQIDFQIEHWEAGYIMENNSFVYDTDPESDCYWNPLDLWNSLQEQVVWQRRRGVVNFESARQLILQDAAEMRAFWASQKNKREAIAG